MVANVDFCPFGTLTTKNTPLLTVGAASFTAVGLVRSIPHYRSGLAALRADGGGTAPSPDPFRCAECGIPPFSRDLFYPVGFEPVGIVFRTLRGREQGSCSKVEGSLAVGRTFYHRDPVVVS